MKPSKKGATYAFCKVCGADIAIGGSGLCDLQRHIKSGKHTSLLKQVTSQPSIVTTMEVAGNSQNIHDQALAAEILFAKFLAEHNLPFLLADHFSPLCKVMFPDSKVVGVYAAARTKTKAIITHALAPKFMIGVRSRCLSIWPLHYTV